MEPRSRVLLEAVPLIAAATPSSFRSSPTSSCAAPDPVAQPHQSGDVPMTTLSPPSSGEPVTWVWTGELDAGDIETLTDLWQSVAGRHPRQVTIDMGGVTFLDCAVVSFLLGVRRQAGPRLVLTCVPPVAARLFRWTGLIDALAPFSPLPPAAPPTADAARLQDAF